MARWNAKQEIEAATKMREAEGIALGLISEMPEVAHILGRRSNRIEKTVSAAIDRLNEAVKHLVEIRSSIKGARKKKKVLEAERHLKVANEWRWKLAMSAKHISRAESFKRTGCEEDQQELDQVGAIGLMDAAKRFNPGLELRFTTYARWWVVARMARHANPFPVKVSPNFIEKRTKVMKAKSKLDKIGIEWDIEDLASHAGLSVSQTKKVLNQPLQSVSLSTPVHDGVEGRQKLLVDDIADENLSDPTEDLHRARMVKWLKASIGELPPRQRHVIRMRYGLDNGKWKTLSEVGRQMKLSRERIRQIESDAITSLREREPPGIDPGMIQIKDEKLAKKGSDIPIREEELLEKLNDKTAISKSIITNELSLSQSDADKRKVLAALKRMEQKGAVVRTGQGTSTKWMLAPEKKKEPSAGAPWKERVLYVLEKNPWSTSGKIAEILDEKERFKSLSAILGIMCQTGVLVRRPVGRSFEYMSASKSGLTPTVS